METRDKKNARKNIDGAHVDCSGKPMKLREEHQRQQNMAVYIITRRAINEQNRGYFQILAQQRKVFISQGPLLHSRKKITKHVTPEWHGLPSDSIGHNGRSTRKREESIKISGKTDIEGKKTLH